MDIPFCSQAYLFQTFLRSRYPDKQEREAVCREYGIDDSYDFKFIYSDDEYDEAMEARNDSYVAAARHYFSFMPLDGDPTNADYVYADFEEYFCFAYALLWCVENGYEPVGKGLF